MEKDNSEEKREWLINIIIGVRREVLLKLRELSDSFDREVYTKAQRNAINQEIREIAEMVSEKDSIMERLEELLDLPVSKGFKDESIVGITRAKVKKMLNEMKDNILSVEYDGEYSIIEKELKEIALMVDDKDKLVKSEVPMCYSKGKENPYIRKYFKIDDEPGIE